MSAHVNVYINCDGADLPNGRTNDCGWWSDSGGWRSATEARRAIKPSGWTRKRINAALLDLCPACTSEAVA